MPEDIFPDRDAVIPIIELEIKLHPLARPLDIYKLLMQAAYGPGHLISDVHQATQAILSEMAEVRSCDSEPYQSLDAGFGYIRYSLCNLLPYKTQDRALLPEKAAQLAAIMVRSCDVSHEKPNLCELWKAYLPEVKARLNAPEQEWQEVQLLADKNIISSHSSIYKTAYQPHYRVINKHLLPIKE